MVEFSDNHKAEMKAVSGLTSEIEWFDDKGQFSKLDLTKVETHDLWALRNELNSFWSRQLKVIDEELDNWSEIICSVCGQQDLAYRGQPFITWGFRAGYILCPKHVMAYDRIGTPEDEIIKQAKAEEAELKSVFG